MELSVLPPVVHRAYFQIPETRRKRLMEIRFRMDRPVTVLEPEGEQILGEQLIATEALLEELLNRATGFSPYALKLEETGLYLPLKAGGRLGLCGEVVMRDGRIHGIRKLSSASLRLAREVKGIAGETADRLSEGGQAASALIISPPGGGKTTFLRDLIRCMSNKGFRVSVADERRELSGMGEGKAGLDLGPCTDVLCGCPKERAMPLLIRAMNPQILAVDELAGREEVAAALYAAFSGVALLATVHGEDLSSLKNRPLYRELVESGAFAWLITLKYGEKPKMERLGIHAETAGCDICHRGVADGGLCRRAGAEQASDAAEATAFGAGTYAGRDGTEYAARGGAVPGGWIQNRR